MIEILALLSLLFSWLLPTHFPPWVSWHNEVLAFFAVLLMSVRLTALDKKGRESPIGSPKVSVVFLVLAAVVATQFAIGFITFSGDAAILLMYFALCWLALLVGFHFAGVELDLRKYRYRLSAAEAMAVILVTGAVFSTAIALFQVFDVWGQLELVSRMPMLRRPGGNLGQPNQLATLILMGLISLYFLYETGRTHCVTAICLTLFLILGLAVTESRTGVVGIFLLFAWWFVRRRNIDFKLAAITACAILAGFMVVIWLWPTFIANVHAGGNLFAESGTLNTNAGTRLVVWPQLIEAALQRPIFGWGLHELPKAHNAVLHAYSESEPFTYAHNVILDLAVGVGLPLTALTVGAVVVWFWARAKAANDMVTWYCLAVAIPFAVHSSFEFPFAYAYFLVPVMFLIGVLEARLAPASVFRVPPWTMTTVWTIASVVMAWSVVEYVQIEEDFRVARFEALHIGKTPGDYERPKIYLLTQLDALLEGGRIVPMLAMEPQRIELARKVALRFPWPATQNRYALALALNGNVPEAQRQLRVMHAMHGNTIYEVIRVQWNSWAQEKYPQLRGLVPP